MAETIFQSTMSWRETRTLSSTWWDEVTDWFGSLSPALAGFTPTAWLLSLLPGAIDEQLQAPEGALHIYQRLVWTQIPPIDRPLDFQVTPSWVSTRGAHAEVGLTTDACCNGRLLARGVSAVRQEGPMPSWGQRGVRSTPREHEALSACDLPVPLESVRTFGKLIGAHYRIHDDLEYARSQGFENVLIQGVAVAAIAMALARPANRGHAEFWFRRPLVADRDVRIAVGESADETGVTAGTPEVIAMVGRITNETCETGRSTLHAIGVS